ARHRAPDPALLHLVRRHIDLRVLRVEDVDGHVLAVDLHDLHAENRADADRGLDNGFALGEFHHGTDILWSVMGDCKVRLSGPAWVPGGSLCRDRCTGAREELMA